MNPGIMRSISCRSPPLAVAVRPKGLLKCSCRYIAVPAFLLTRKQKETFRCIIIQNFLKLIHLCSME